jgi:hypothetical protein
MSEMSETSRLANSAQSNQNREVNQFSDASYYDEVTTLDAVSQMNENSGKLTSDDVYVSCLDQFE